MRIRTERDARALAGLRDMLATVSDASTGGDASREARDRVYGLLRDIDAAFASGLAWCHADAMPEVRFDDKSGWTVRCEECGAWLARGTLSEAEEGWNDHVASLYASDEEGSE